jgi:hypothetical protein
MRLFRFLALVAALLVVVLTPLPALAQESVTLKIGKNSALLDGGQAVSVTVTASCKNDVVLEAFVYVVQDGNQSQFAGIALQCDGARHRFTVRVNALDFLFHEGEARASGFVLLESGATISPTRLISIRG